MINPEVPPMCDPLRPENRLIFSGSSEWYTPGGYQPNIHRHPGVESREGIQ